MILSAHIIFGLSNIIFRNNYPSVNLFSQPSSPPFSIRSHPTWLPIYYKSNNPRWLCNPRSSSVYWRPPTFYASVLFTLHIYYGNWLDSAELKFPGLIGTTWCFSRSGKEYMWHSSLPLVPSSYPGRLASRNSPDSNDLLCPFLNPRHRSRRKHSLSIVEKACLERRCVRTKVIQLLLAYSLPRVCVYRAVD
jgi:hypothetical protein